VPFINKGFNYKDRRVAATKSTADPMLEKQRQISFIAYKDVIDKFRRKLEEAMLQKNPFKVEKMLQDIANYPNEKAEIGHHLRMDVIKA